jgi:hypothetical protein
MEVKERKRSTMSSKYDTVGVVKGKRERENYEMEVCELIVNLPNILLPCGEYSLLPLLLKVNQRRGRLIRPLEFAFLSGTKSPERIRNGRHWPRLSTAPACKRPCPATHRGELNAKRMQHRAVKISDWGVPGNHVSR